MKLNRRAMVCRELEQFLHPYLDGEFDPGDTVDLEEHLDSCSTCHRTVEEERALREKIRLSLARSTASAPQDLRSKIQTRIAVERRRTVLSQWSRYGARAALVAAAVGGALLYFKGDPRLALNTRPRFLEEAVVRHARGLPFEIQTPSPEGVEAWFGGKLLHRVAVPRFPHAVVTGARLSNVTDKEAAYISYDTSTPNRAHGRMGLFVFHDDAERFDARPWPAVRVSSTHGYNVAVWREGEIVYELVTDLDEGDIRQVLEPRMAGNTATLAANPLQSLPMMTPTPRTVQPASFQP